jgi:hypothetical protein
VNGGVLRTLQPAPKHNNQYLGDGGEASLQGAAAAEYDRAFAHVTAHFMPFMLRAAHIAPGMRVLDIATGTGLSAEVALAAVGPPRAALIPLLTADLPLKM